MSMKNYSHTITLYCDATVHTTNVMSMPLSEGNVCLMSSQDKENVTAQNNQTCGLIDLKMIEEQRHPLPLQETPPLPELEKEEKQGHDAETVQESKTQDQGSVNEDQLGYYKVVAGNTIRQYQVAFPLLL